MLAGSVLAARAADGSEYPAYHAEQAVAGTLHSVGSDSMDVMTFGWIQAFRRLHPAVKITMEARSSATAAPALIAGLADLAPCPREWLPGELAEFKERYGYAPLAIVVASGSYATNERSPALAVFVHQDNPLRQLTLAQLGAIYAAGPEALTRWGQLGLTGDWADRPINLYGIHRPDGSAFFFGSVVLHGRDFRPDIRERGNARDARPFGPVAASIRDDRNGIGYATFGDQQNGIKTLALATTEQGPFVTGSLEAVQARKYPLTRSLYIYLNRPPGRPLPAALRELLHFVLSREGQQVIADQNVYLPLLPAELAVERAKLD